MNETIWRDNETLKEELQSRGLYVIQIGQKHQVNYLIVSTEPPIDLS